MTNKNDQSFQYDLVDSNQKFEVLLSTNNLFVDYFNEFLLSPSLGEKVKFNIVSGDLEYIDDRDGLVDKSLVESKIEFDRENIKDLINNKLDRSIGHNPSSTAELVKKNLDFQLKSIIKKTQSEKTFINDELDLKEQEILSQANNHSFKDIDLVRIESRLEPCDLKDPKATAESKIPTLRTRYSVNILKKPFSMDWLKYRRLTLFLQSELYSEFKIAMILAQFAMFNNEIKNENNDSNANKIIKQVKIDIDPELIEMELNPFKAKNDLEKLHDYKFDDEDSYVKPEASLHLAKNVEEKLDDKTETDFEEFLKQTESMENFGENLADEADNKFKDNNHFFLIDNDREFYKSLSEIKLKTSLITSKKTKEFEQNNINNNDNNNNNNKINSNTTNSNNIISKSLTESKNHNGSQEIKLVNSVNEMANILVRSVITQALSDYHESNISEKNENRIEKVYRYSFSAKKESEEINLSDFNKKKTNSRLSYYKNFLPDDTFETNENDEDNKYTIEFEDEPYELTDSKHFQEIYLRKPEIENFKNYLKENDAFILYRLWIDIEKLSTLINQKEKINYIKHLKATYNKPNVLNRLNKDYDRTNVGKKKSKYYELYSQYENNLEFWSVEYLTNTIQKRILKTLIDYYWPKYCIRMDSFKDYVQKKYPSYYVQKNLYKKVQKQTDLDAENIEKSLKYPFSLKSSLTKRNETRDNVRNKKKSQSKVKILENSSLVMSKISSHKFDQASTITANSNQRSKSIFLNELSGYDLDDYKTSPPVGWKRPISRATQLAKTIYENKNNQNENKFSHKRSKTDKEIYLEAIYRQDISGQIFMKYLMNKNKTFAINRLKCLLELIKYKDLFYDDNFNQEDAKKKALELYSKYIAVSANYSIDCPKQDRLKLHHLFVENPKNSIVSIKANSVFIPTYEDTFDAVEEFLLIALYDDWKIFMETEENFFKHNEIENIERSINIKSKKIDELLEQGLLKMDPKSVNYNSNNTNDFNSKKSSLYEPSIFKDFTLGGDFDHQSSKSSFFDLNELMNNTRDFEMFKSFLESNNALNDILCWMDIEAYSRIDPYEEEKIEEQAKRLKRLYLNKKYLFSKTGPLDEETQNLILEKIGGWSILLQDIPPNLLIVLAKKHIENKLKTYWLPRYLNSEHKRRSAFKNRTQMMDVVDDVLYLKNRMPSTKEYSKIKKNRWLYSSQMIINFGKALRNSFTTKVFSKFLSYKSTPTDANPFDLETSNNLVNDLQFLVEVQDYKEMYQRNPENERPIIQKMKHIIDCFINNRIPPKTRIDIPEQLAENIIDQKDYLSPYLFLNANLIVFNTLMPYWIEFNQVRSGKELELFDEFSTFKKMKDYRPSSTKRVQSAVSQDDYSNEEQTTKWRYNQYIKALKTQLVI